MGGHGGRAEAAESGQRRALALPSQRLVLGWATVRQVRRRGLKGRQGTSASLPTESTIGLESPFVYVWIPHPIGYAVEKN